MSTAREHPPLGRLPYEHRPHFEQNNNHHHDGGGYGYDGDDREPQHHGSGGHWRHDDRRRQRPPRYNDYGRSRRAGALQWTAAVVFTVLAVAVLLAAVTILVVVLLLQPKSPYIAVRSAHLDALVYPQSGATLDDVQLTLLVEARNGNRRSAAEFSRLELRLAFGGAVLAKLRADPFGVPPEGSLPLAYVARAQGAPLDAAGSAAVEGALRGGVVPFGIDGEVKTAWKVGGIVGVRHWTRMACEIRFFWPNGSAMHFNCKSKSKFLFF